MIDLTYSVDRCSGKHSTGWISGSPPERVETFAAGVFEWLPWPDWDASDLDNRWVIGVLETVTGQQRVFLLP
jgi:hypothetical protein